MKIKLIAFDLDGTLLRDNKELSRRNIEALSRAAELGIHLVPATGRLYDGMPEEVIRLPFIRYMIGVNGAVILDIKEKRVLHRAELTKEESRQIFDYVKEPPAIWGCYKNGEGWMERKDYERIEDYAASGPIGRTMQRLYIPVEHMQEKLLETEGLIQKLQLFYTDLEAKEEMRRDLIREFPKLSITSSLPNNIEINAADANKGAGLRALCGHLGIDIQACMAIGDGANDLTIIREAGLGVAMGNACPELLASADQIAKTNEEDGVADFLERYILPG